MSEGPAGELSATPAAKLSRRDGDRMGLLRWPNRRLDVVNVVDTLELSEQTRRLGTVL
jgi:hypothetical protein